jgi:hypothetical protein
MDQVARPLNQAALRAVPRPELSPPRGALAGAQAPLPTGERARGGATISIPGRHGWPLVLARCKARG